MVVAFRRGTAVAGVTNSERMDTTWPEEWGDFDKRLVKPSLPNPTLAAALRRLGAAERLQPVGPGQITEVLQSAVTVEERAVAHASLATQLSTFERVTAEGFADEALCSDAPLGPELLLGVLQIAGQSQRPEHLVALAGAVAVGRRWPGAPRLDALLDELGEAAMQQGDLVAAGLAFQESLRLLGRAIAIAPTMTVLHRDREWVAEAIAKLGAGNPSPSP